MRTHQRMTIALALSLLAGSPAWAEGSARAGSTHMAQGSSEMAEGSALLVGSGLQVTAGVVALPLMGTGALLTGAGEGSTAAGESLWDAATTELPLDEGVHLGEGEPSPAAALHGRPDGVGEPRR